MGYTYTNEGYWGSGILVIQGEKVVQSPQQTDTELKRQVVQGRRQGWNADPKTSQAQRVGRLKNQDH